MGSEIDTMRLAWALHNAGIGCMRPLALSRDLCVPTNERYSDLHPYAAVQIINEYEEVEEQYRDRTESDGYSAGPSGRSRSA